MLLYHGSNQIIKKPIYGIGSPKNDYGLGFYCTENIDLAKEWASADSIDGYVNSYELDTRRLSIMNLSSDEYSVLNWLAILMDNRFARLNSPIEKRATAYLIDNFIPSYKDYDVIVGYRADDSYFSFARAFVSNSISLTQLEYAMKLGKLGEQIVLKSEKAFEQIEFIDYSVVNHGEYFPKRMNRDSEARTAFRRVVEKDDITGIYMRDIIREGMVNNDVRLR